MIPFKEAIALWEHPFGEKMVPYNVLSRKARLQPNNIFVIVCWNEDQQIIDYKSFDVGLVHVDRRWILNKEKFMQALNNKIKAVEYTNSVGKTDIQIRYPERIITHG